uniref:RIN4 pathogenic type III effector avirulence factor Avr cleavage site domain-containing protein n=1 Tax=Oryza punctata TaxID=4537 RepID=A0A0E0LX45_ORYPU
MLQQQQKKNAHVPKFGNWDNDGNVPYTVYFENARKGKVAAGAGAGKMFNPNDPVDNPEAFSSIAAPSPSRATPPSHHERAPSDAPPPPPAPYAGGSPYHRHAAGGGEAAPARRGGRTSGGGSYSVEHSPSPSPLHPYSESGSSYGGLVANSRAKGGGAPRGNETVSPSASAQLSTIDSEPTRGSAVPRFGDWDSNPASADGYTHIFNKVREEKQTGQAAGKPPAALTAAGHGNAAKRHQDDDDYASTVSHSN